jgi:hypothetical protein
MLDFWQSPYILRNNGMYLIRPGSKFTRRREALVAGGIRHGEHVLDVGVVEHRLEGLGSLAVVDALARAVLPHELVAVDPLEEIRIGFEQRRDRPRLASRRARRPARFPER